MPYEKEGFQFKQLMPVLIPIGSVVASVLSVAIAFTKVQMESNVNAAQLAAIDNRLDRFQTAFDVFRQESNKDNRERDRTIEHSSALNDAQNAMLDRIITSLRVIQADLYKLPTRPSQQSLPTIPLLPLDPQQEAMKGVN